MKCYLDNKLLAFFGIKLNKYTYLIIERITAKWSIVFKTQLTG